MSELKYVVSLFVYLDTIVSPPLPDKLYVNTGHIASSYMLYSCNEYDYVILKSKCAYFKAYTPPAPHFSLS